MRTRTVTFYSEGQVIAADLYLPDNTKENEKLPAIISCTGFTGIRLMMQPQYAKYFTEAGYAFLAFDYRGWGGSGGERGRLAPLEQVDDVRNAITYMEAQSFVDPSRIALYGVSFGANIAPYVTAIDKRVKCVLIKGGGGAGRHAITRHRVPGQMEEWEEKIKQAKTRRVLSNEIERPLRVLDIFLDDDSKNWLGQGWELVPEWRTYFGFDSVARVMDFEIAHMVPRISPRPFGVVCALRDTTGDPKIIRATFESAGEPKRWIEMDCSHYDYYAGPLLDVVMGHIVQFYDEYL